MILNKKSQTSFIQRHPNLIAMLFGVLMCIIMIGLIEVGIYAYIELNDISLSNFERKYAKNYWVEGKQKLNEGAHPASVKVKKTGEVIYDVIYTIDEYGRRITPVLNSDQRDKFMLFVGGSFTIGEGVEDHQTMPAYVGTRPSEYRPYNYGFHGFGPFDVLTRMQHMNFKDQIKEKNGVLIYTFIDDHIHRCIGSMRVIRWKAPHPYYQYTKQSGFVRKGSFKTGRPLLTFAYEMISKSKILRFLNITLPLKISEKHLELTTQTLAAIKDEFHNLYPNDKFYVLFYPGSKYSDRLIKHFKRHDIAFFDYTDLFDKDDPRYYLAKEDTHPTPQAYQEVVVQLMKDIQKKH